MTATYEDVEVEKQVGQIRNKPLSLAGVLVTLSSFYMSFLDTFKHPQSREALKRPEVGYLPISPYSVTFEPAASVWSQFIVMHEAVDDSQTNAL